MQKGPKPAELTLSEEEHKRLEALVHRHTTPQQLAKRGRMIRASAEGKRNAEIARELGVCVDTVRSWRGRWISLQAVPLTPTLGGRAAHGCATSRQALPNHHRATVSDGGYGLRATKRTPDQSLDRARNCR